MIIKNEKTWQAERYKDNKVFHLNIGGNQLKDYVFDVFARYNQAFPPDYRGRSIAPSDVLELYDESERRYFYCDMAGFPQVKFSPALAKKA